MHRGIKTLWCGVVALCCLAACGGSGDAGGDVPGTINPPVNGSDTDFPLPPLSGNGITLAHFTYQPARQNTTLWTWRFIPQANAGIRSVEFLLGNESLLTI